jgi:uncharacterized membrane-anchored protein YhcB (DUF1043 family)
MTWAFVALVLLVGWAIGYVVVLATRCWSR